jgi:hypothetical protein
MTPTLTAEQQELRDSFRSFLAEHASIATVRERFESAAAPDSALWIKLMDLGVLAYFSENTASGGGLFRDLGLLAAEAGYGLLPENLIDAALVAHILSTRVTEGEKQAILALCGPGIFSEISDGSVRLAMTAASSDFVTLESAGGKSQKLSASVRFVAGPTHPGILLLTEMKKDAIYLCDLRASTSGGTIEDSLDRTQRRFAIRLNELPSIRLSSLSAKTIGFMQRSLRAAELSGAAKKALDLTVDYVKSREQFDVPVGGFQAVQHAAADMLVKVEALSALADFACWAADSSVEQLELAALSAAIYGSEEAPKAIEKAIQLHGGIGFTWEHDLHLLLRRARTVAALVAASDETYTDLLAAARQS